MVTKQFRDLWYKRCTDGSYHQEKHVLVDKNDPKARCCLGVAHAVAQELGLLPADATTQDGRDIELLTSEELEAIGLEGDQRTFSEANDANQHQDGEYYPQQVLTLIKNLPVKD